MTKLFIFDWDGTIMDETLFSQIPILLEELRTYDHRMSIASFNPHVSFYCNRYGLSGYFDCVVGRRPKIKNDCSKFTHINEILNFYISKNLIIDEIIFIDDNQNTINDIKIRFHKLKCVNVNPKLGVQKIDILSFI